MRTSQYHELISKLLSDTCSDPEREELFNALVALPFTADLLTTCVRVMREQMIPVRLNSIPIDTCGTGGSGKKTINTSTLAALIVAAAGGLVAKHGNRSASGNCGSFDVLEHLGVRVNLTISEEQNVFDSLGIVFLFAPFHHPALRHIAHLRKRHGKKTIFNLAGPLCNPAGVQKQIIGVTSDADAQLIAGSLANLGNVGSMVVLGDDNLDEISIAASSTIYHVNKKGNDEERCSPADFGLPEASDAELSGGDAERNAEIFLDILRGDGSTAHTNLVIANAAYALVLAGIATSPQQGANIARDTLVSGKVFALFNRYKRYVNELTP